MGFLKFFLLQIGILCAILSSSTQSYKVEANDDRKVHIVYMGAKTEENLVSTTNHLNILKRVISGRSPKEALVRSYTRSFNGFAAKLTIKESNSLKGMPGVVSVFPSRTLQLHTTRSWDFIGLPLPSLDPIHMPKNNTTILGVMDSGIWPESPSFNDEGFGPPPKKWKGVCLGGNNFTCNNKIIGARTYASNSARDIDGHGSHTSSIAAGRLVTNTSFYGFANGTARGGAPFARIAVYQVCDAKGCADHNILAGFDDAIADGVDLITISAGGLLGTRLYKDAIAIGSFHALNKGILTVQAAGNSAPLFSVSSVAPWIFTVAASTTDRKMIDKIVLGNGTTLIGNSVNTFVMKGDKFPLIYQQDNLDVSGSVEGKIVVGVEPEKIDDLVFGKAAGAVSLEYEDDVSTIVPLPATMLYNQTYTDITAYMNSTKNPVATILRTEIVNDTNAPVVASFSSRGPNTVSPDILKPDITAPGVEILAAYSPTVPISWYKSDTRKVMYNIISGTSMSCPHVAGAATYLKELYPDWSPATIKSALMTTARRMSPKLNPEGEFAYGAGHLDPVKAVYPGLVFETTQDDYITYMCKLNYTKEQIGLITGNKSVSCPPKSNIDDLSPTDVNYPTMSKIVESGKPFKVQFTRTVTYVPRNFCSTFRPTIELSSSKIKVTVEPNVMFFEREKEQKSFNVTVVGEGITSSQFPVTASLVWSDTEHYVRSPIVLYASV